MKVNHQRSDLIQRMGASSKKWFFFIQNSCSTCGSSNENANWFLCHWWRSREGETIRLGWMTMEEKWQRSSTASERKKWRYLCALKWCWHGTAWHVLGQKIIRNDAVSLVDSLDMCSLEKWLPWARARMEHIPFRFHYFLFFFSDALIDDVTDHAW